MFAIESQSIIRLPFDYGKNDSWKISQFDGLVEPRMVRVQATGAVNARLLLCQNEWQDEQNDTFSPPDYTGIVFPDANQAEEAAELLEERLLLG
jgi:hypothetical protein